MVKVYFEKSILNKGGVEKLQKRYITFTLFREKELLNIFHSFMKVDYHENLEFITISCFLPLYLTHFGTIYIRKYKKN